MFNKKVEVNKKYSISRSESQYICTFHAVESEQPGEVVRTFPCVLSMHGTLTEEGHCGNELMAAVSYLLDMK